MIHTSYSIRDAQNRALMRTGFRDGIPIGLGYFAVSFSLGIAAKDAGLSPFQGLLTSLLVNASAGQHAGFSLIALGGSFLELALITLIANARYLLMSFAMSQRVDPNMGLGHRAAMSFHITDELFAIAIARPGYLNPWYSYGAALAASPMWAAGTAAGIIAGNLLPARLVSALSVALYGMFLAVIVPAGRKDKTVLGLILASFAASFAASSIPFLAQISGGVRTILLTLLLASAAAVLFPRKEAAQ